MIYVWKRLSEDDVERIAKKYNLEPFEKRLLELRCKGKSIDFVADEIGYCAMSVKRHSKRILKKIADDL